jgi:hypothetical protein
MGTVQGDGSETSASIGDPRQRLGDLLVASFCDALVRAHILPTICVRLQITRVMMSNEFVQLKQCFSALIR